MSAGKLPGLGQVFEHGREVARRPVALGRALRHEPAHHGRHRRRHLAPQLIDRRRRLLALPVQLLNQRAAGERYLARQQEVERAAQRVEVGPDVGAVRVFELLRRDVVRRADDRPVARQRGQRLLRRMRELVQPGHAHVEDLDQRPRRRRKKGTVPLRRGGQSPFFGGRDHHQVRRLDVAVDQRLFRGVLEPERRLPHKVARLGHRQRPVAIDEFLQRDARHILHRQVVGVAALVRFVDADDVGVRQPGRGLGFTAEAVDDVVARQPFVADHLERDDTVRRNLARPVDDAHAAVAQLFEDLVAGDDGKPGVTPGERRRLHRREERRRV